MKDPTKKTIRVSRVIMIDFNHYYTLDYYPDVIGQPLLLIVKKGYDKTKELKMKFPPIEKIVPIFREVSNEPEYSTLVMSSKDYVMPEQDRLGTQLASSSFKSKPPPGIQNRPHSTSDDI